MHSDPLIAVASSLAGLIHEAAELINVRVKLEHVASDFEVSLAAGQFEENEGGFALARLVVSEEVTNLSLNDDLGVPNRQEDALQDWLSSQVIPKIVFFTEKASIGFEQCYGLARIADFAVVSSAAPTLLLEMVRLASDGNFFTLEGHNSHATVAPAIGQNKQGRRSNSSSVGQEKKREKQTDIKKVDSKKRCEVQIFGQDDHIFDVLNAVADLARVVRDYQFDLRWTPSQSDPVLCLTVGTQKCHIERAELLRSVSDIWGMIKENRLNSEGPVEVITNTRAAPPPPVGRLLENLKKYSTRAFPRTVADYKFREEQLPCETWLVLRSGDRLHEIKNADLLLGSREIQELLKSRLSSISPARFLLGRAGELPETDIPVILVSGPSPDLGWVQRILSSEGSGPVVELETSEADAHDDVMTDREYKRILRELAWLRRLEYSAREIAEQTLTDHVAHAKWEQGQFDLQHQREAESERRAAEVANKKLLDLSITIPADSLEVQKDAVSRFVAEMSVIQASIGGSELGEPEKEAEEVCASCLKIVEEKLASEHKSDSKKSTREALTEAITSALQAPLRFVLPFAFLIVPFIVLFIPVDPSKSDSQIIQNTMRTYGFMLLPLFFLLAASSRWLALQENSKLRNAKRIELLRSELIGKLSAKRTDLTSSNTNQMETRSQERKMRREEAGRRIERRLSALNAVRSQINKGVEDARKLRDETFRNLPALKTDLAVARSLLPGPENERQRVVP